MASNKQAKTETPEPITVTIDGEPYTLKASRAARKKFDNFIGGTQPALNGVQNLNYDIMAMIVCAGADMKVNQTNVDSIADELWANGDSATISKVADYAVRMSHGGKDPEPANDDADDGKVGGKDATAEGNP